jgi:predicted DsbA family dithiol-disulfide isomerase
MALRIDVISDVVCPWCFIGKRRLERALTLLSEDGVERSDIEIVWRPFQLNPQLPREGMSRAQYVAQKFGGQADEIYARVARVGAEVGIAFAFERIASQPNTLAAHQLIDLARENGAQHALVESLFTGYFVEGEDLTQHAVLIGLAERAGVDPARACEVLSDETHRAGVSEQDEEARELGVSGVPFFVFGGQLAVSGAQEPQVLMRAFKQAAAEMLA